MAATWLSEVKGSEMGMMGQGVWVRRYSSWYSS